MDADEHGLNTEVRDCVFSLSANEVGGEGRDEVAREAQISSPCPSPRLGGARGTEHIPRAVFIHVHPCSFRFRFASARQAVV
jgi:hypothetical protein